MNTKKRRIALEMDAGSGGVAAALLAASSGRLGLEGVMACWGALPPADAAAQALMAAELLKKQFPIYPGCPAPLVRDLYRRGVEREESGREKARSVSPGPPLLPDARQGRHAVDYLVSRCRSGEGKLTIAVLGPLTDLAAAICIAPDLVKNVREIVVAAGGVGAPPDAFCPQGNVFQDPEAAKIVLESGARVVLFPRTAVCGAALPPGCAARCRAQGGPAAELFARLLEGQALAYSGPQVRRQAGTAAAEAALCIAYLVDSRVVDRLEHARLDICLDRGAGRGVLLSADRRSGKKKNVWIARGAKAKLLEAVVLELLRSASAGLEKEEKDV